MTKRRILLTGTPLQNNLREYYHMVDFASPGELGELKTFTKLFEEIIGRGQWKAAEGESGNHAAELQVWK
jgi:SNF2 family DNA or RNA helicase